MLGTEPPRNWRRRSVTLAAAAGLLAGVVIGGAGHSLPAASTHVMTAPATLPLRPRPTVTATVAGPTSTVTATVTRTVPAGAAPPTSTPTPPAAATPAGTPVEVPSTPAGTPAAGPTEAPPVSIAPLDSGPTALCRDGTLSYAVHHEASCAHHRGIAAWYR